MNMRQRIEQIYELLGKIPVAGESVDLMATVRYELRAIHKMILAEDAKKSQAKNAPSEKETAEVNPETEVTDHG